MSPSDFQDAFLGRYLKGSTRWNEAEYLLLDYFFGFVEDFVDDPDLRAATGGEDLASLRAATARRLSDWEL
jgi:hypothetical protein